MTGKPDHPNIRRSGHEFRSPILALPGELRVTVYRALWTLPVSHRLIAGLKSLAKICHKIRDEVLHEYITHILPVTQIHLGSKRSVHKVLRGSPFLFQHIQHVSLLWGGCMCVDDSYRGIAQRGDHSRGFRWLRKLPQLKSLELVFTDPSYKEMQRFSRGRLALPAPTVAEEEVDYQEFVHVLLRMSQPPHTFAAHVEESGLQSLERRFYCLYRQRDLGRHRMASQEEDPGGEIPGA